MLSFRGIVLSPTESPVHQRPAFLSVCVCLFFNPLTPLAAGTCKVEALAGFFCFLLSQFIDPEYSFIHEKTLEEAG